MSSVQLPTHGSDRNGPGGGDPAVSTVAVIGLGYVGLPSALALADAGARVIGCDTSEDRLAAIKAGRVDLLPADHRRLERHLASDAFVLTTNLAMTSTVDAVIVCVPTPVDAHLVPDVTALAAACQTSTAYAVPGQTIVLTSTTYVGCTRRLLVEPLAARGLTAGQDVFVAFSPERIDPGNATYPHESVPRVVGGVTQACRRRAAQVVSLMTTTVHEVSSPEAAEASKLLENSFRAVNIALANEFADAFGQLGLDPLEVVEAAATKPYGFMPFYPGPGVGGHCIPCDPHYLLWQLRARRTRLPLAEAAMAAIAMRPRHVVTRACEVLGTAGRSPVGARVLIVGVSYKPGVCDLRESPALEIIKELTERGADVAYADPLVGELHIGAHRLTGIPEPEHCRWDLVIVHTLHPGVDYGWLAEQPVVLDTTYRATHLPDRALL